ncbi:MAG: sulfatase-like hydrolase/transferase, partial [Planctomycetota bacterium]
MKRPPLIALGIALLTSTAFTKNLRAEVTKPNILLIVVDDLGWNDVGYHNPEMHTPNIDKLVTGNVELSRVYVTPQCSPTRAGLLTGRYPHRFGMLDHVISPTQADGMPESEYTLAEMLGDAGYQHRAMMGKWHLGLRSKIFHPLNHGFTEFYGHYNGAIDYFRHKRRGETDWHRNYETIDEEGYSTDLLSDEAARYIELKSSEETPWFLYLAYNAPHSPLQALEDDLTSEGFDESSERMKSDDARIAKKEGDPDYGRAGTGNNKRQTFKANVRALDRGIGQVIKAIDDSGEGENTLVLFTSDNGGIPSHGGSNVPLRGNKFQIYEGGVRVPAAVRWP